MPCRLQTIKVAHIARTCIRLVHLHVHRDTLCSDEAIPEGGPLSLFHRAPAHEGGMDLTALLAAAASPNGGGGITLGADVLSCNLHLLPAGAFPVIGLYVTQAGGGSGYIAATEAQLAEHPGCVKIAQLPTGDPYWADVLDYEAGAATAAELATWAEGARLSYKEGSHPGQRMPAVYVDASNVHVAVNTLTAGGITSGVGLGIANWNLTEAVAVRDVINRAGPFPVVWVQYADAGPYDLDVWSTAWLNARSGKPQTAGYGPPRDLRAVGGDTSVRLTWQPPGTPGLPDPAGYIVYVYRGTTCTRSSLMPTYGPDGRHVGPVAGWQGGSLGRGGTYTAHVVAAGENGADRLPVTFASAVFRTS